MPFNFLNGPEGEQSSKRLFTFLIVVCWCVYFFANLFWGKVLKDSLEDHLLTLALAFFTGVTVDKWIPKVVTSTKKKDDEKTAP